MEDLIGGSEDSGTVVVPNDEVFETLKQEKLLDIERDFKSVFREAGAYASQGEGDATGARATEGGADAAKTPKPQIYENFRKKLKSQSKNESKNYFFVNEFYKE